MKNVFWAGQILIGLIVVAGIVLLVTKPSPFSAITGPEADLATTPPATDDQMMERDDAAGARTGVAAVSSEPEIDAPEIGGLETNRANRNVTPEGVLPAPEVAWPIERVAPRPTPEPRKPPPAPARFFRVGVPDAGRITTRRGYDVVLSGIDAPAADDTCVDDKGAIWPCGRAAKASLSRLIRGRAVECDIEPERLAALVEAKLTIRAVCHVAGREINSWLVEQGWARPDGDERLGEAFETAKSEGLGLWTEDWSAR